MIKIKKILNKSENKDLLISLGNLHKQSLIYIEMIANLKIEIKELKESYEKKIQEKQNQIIDLQKKYI